MDVLVQVSLEGCQGLIQRVEADASIGRSGVAVARLTKSAQCVTGGVVFMDHHRHRILYAPERSRQNRLFLNDGFFHATDVREQDPLFFHHVHGQLFGQTLKGRMHGKQF